MVEADHKQPFLALLAVGCGSGASWIVSGNGFTYRVN